MESKGGHPPFLKELFALTQLIDMKRLHEQNWIPHNAPQKGYSYVLLLVAVPGSFHNIGPPKDSQTN